MFRLQPQLRITLYYLVFGAVWIFWSDKALNVLFQDPETLTFLQTMKGWFFIAITSVFLYLLIRQSAESIRAQEREKERVYGATLAAMHHILNNFLNQMKLFHLEAERSEDFDSEVLSCYEQVIGEAKDQIAGLESVADVTAESIRETVSLT